MYDFLAALNNVYSVEQAWPTSERAGAAFSTVRPQRATSN